MPRHLNDCSFVYEPESSDALGLGFRCGFLGLLHMEIVQERLERESNIDLLQTTPTTSYEVLLNTGELKVIYRPAEMPDGVTIGVLHTGRHYDDDLAANCIEYHYPKTRSPGTDAAEVQATKNAAELNFPVL